MIIKTDLTDESVYSGTTIFESPFNKTSSVTYFIAMLHYSKFYNLNQFSFFNHSQGLASSITRIKWQN